VSEWQEAHANPIVADDDRSRLEVGFDVVEVVEEDLRLMSTFRPRC
jgi:hypothetical protein